ncbi:MAG: 50S ribosomal protein L23 [Candidatus Moranbacteria bacterium GW2011_GWE1_35_17]|nr:MAG: 50S ribosomal protein L23 [Candidatus Moranbacteria bacterium GW2011_GWE1_35_17]KKP72394.1 MAG: 50S ribosomal protein L23 [Candidatus Moranbacteria bacterium GW2011_GWE2_35_164]KKP83795.1 MAG: 50S ribosomal protein L23 [Candidatus Moranbacteria bacterium GW2011_GWF1_35_5]KKP84743.1 MAG: 50S ribosomal protein L23 [Candidatus Moranbacteria bacterium GW2011_GWF2_35_54]
MGLFNKKTEDDAAKDISKEDKVSDSKEIVEKTSKKAIKKADLENIATHQGDGQMAYKFIIKPWITEKTQELMSSNKYVFRLRAKATKREARVAVEKLYDVKVESVNIINIPEKKRKFGRYSGMKSAVRKAVVTLKKGSKIEIFE